MELPLHTPVRILEFVLGFPTLDVLQIILKLLLNHALVNEASMFNGNITVWDTSSAVNMDTMVCISCLKWCL
jgi:hypothetical protein